MTRLNFKKLMTDMGLQARKMPVAIVGKYLGLAEDGPWLCGGSLVRSLIGVPTSGSDFDIYYRTARQEAILADLLNDCEIYRTQLSTTYTATTHHPLTQELVKVDKDVPFTRIQVIPAEDTLEHTFSFFDYTICQLAYDGIDLIAGETTLLDFSQRTLRLNHVNSLRFSAQRLLKYADMGFKPDLSCVRYFIEKALSESHEFDKKDGGYRC